MAEPAVNMMFETPLIEADLADAGEMNAALAAAIASRLAAVELPPAAAWRDEADLHSRAPDAATALAGQAVALAARHSVDVGSPEAPRFDWRSSLSAVAVPTGAELPLAHEPAATWTVHYCIDPGGAGGAAGGLLLLQDPRMPTVHMVAPELRFRLRGGAAAGEPLQSFAPAAGRMMMVPGWLRAGISRYLGPGRQLWVVAHVFAEGRYGAPPPAV